MITRRDFLMMLTGACLLSCGAAARVKLADYDAAIDRLGGQVDRLNVRHAMEHPSSSAVGTDDDEPGLLRRFSRRDSADNLYAPDDKAEFVGRRDTFDRRPSNAKEVKP